MNLLSAFNIASSSLSAVSTQTAITSRNIAGASQAGYTRKHENLTTAIGGDVFVSSIGRAADSSLQAQALDANSALNSSNGLLAGYTHTIGPESKPSPTAPIVLGPTALLVVQTAVVFAALPVCECRCGARAYKR